MLEKPYSIYNVILILIVSFEMTKKISHVIEHVNSKDPDQHVHSSALIRAFTVIGKNGLKVFSAQNVCWFLTVGIRECLMNDQHKL